MKKNLNSIIIVVLFSCLLWVSISLSNDYYTSYEVPIRIVNFPEGYITGTDIPEKVSVRLKGQGWKLIAVSLGTESDYTISAGNDSGRKVVNLYNYLAENQWLSSDIEVIDISPDTLSFYVEKVASKKVKITPNLNLDFKPGYSLATNVVIRPDSTIIYGPSSKIQRLNTIPTEEIKLNNLDEYFVEQVNLKAFQGTSYRNSTVTVVFDVQRIVDKNFNEISVKILDVPKDRDVVLLPNKISIGVRGGINILGKLKENDVDAYVFYRDIVLDTLGSIAPKIEVPDNVSMLYSKPERLRYVIKKFN